MTPSPVLTQPDCVQATEVLQLTPASPSGRDTLRTTLRSLALPTLGDASPDPPIPPNVLSAALNLALGQQQAAQSAVGCSSSSRLSSSAPASSPCSPRAQHRTYTPPGDYASPTPSGTSAISGDSSPLIAAAYPSSQSSATDTTPSLSPRHQATAALRRVSDDGTNDSIASSSGSMHGIRSGTASPPPICRSSPLTTTSPLHGPSEGLAAPPFSHTSFLHPVPENNGGSDDEFEDEIDDCCSDFCDDAAPGHASSGPSIHNAAVFLLTPRCVAPAADPSDDPVAQIRRATACAAPHHHFVPVTTSKRIARSEPGAEPLSDPPRLDLLGVAADPTVVHGTEHSFSRVPPHIYDPLADPALDAFDPAASPRPLSASPYVPIAVYALGVGGLYDPEPLSNIAAATGGAFQHIPRPRDLPPALAAAFGAASAAFAADVEIRVTPLCGSRVSVVSTGYPVWVEGPDVVIHIPEIAARMQKDVLVTLSLPPCTREEMTAPCVKHLAGVATVSYTRARTGKAAVRKSCIVLPRIESVDSARGFGTPDPAAVSEHMRLATAQACADAVRLCAVGSHAPAQKTLLKLRSGIKQLSEVCRAANPRCSDSMRCMHATKVLMHVIADLTAASAAAASQPAFESGGHAVLRAIERSHACQVPQAPTSIRRREAGQCPNGSMLRMRHRSTCKPSDTATPATAACARPPSKDTGAACSAPCKTSTANTAPEVPQPASGARSCAKKMNNMLRRVCKRVRPLRARASDPPAEPVPEPAPTAKCDVSPRAAKVAAAEVAATLPCAADAERASIKVVDGDEVVGVRVSAYTCRAQMALVAAAVRRAEA